MTEKEFVQSVNFREFEQRIHNYLGGLSQVAQNLEGNVDTLTREFSRHKYSEQVWQDNISNRVGVVETVVSPIQEFEQDWKVMRKWAHRVGVYGGACVGLLGWLKGLGYW